MPASPSMPRAKPQLEASSPPLVATSAEPRRIISVDTETTGVDFHHGCKPFFVTTCDPEGNQVYWEWDVDPFTRQPIIPDSDLWDVSEFIFGPNGDDGPDLILQNSKFDVTALLSIMPDIEWPWAKTDDTLIGGHLLASNHPHDLTSMSIEYLGENIQKHEDALKDACVEARKVAKRDFPKWNIAREGNPQLPSIKKSTKRDEEKPWKNDTWLPRAVVKALWERSEAYKFWCQIQNHVAEADIDSIVTLRGIEYCPHHIISEIELEVPSFVGKLEAHPWWTVLSTYANWDTGVTLPLWFKMEELIKQRGLWKIYQSRRKVPRIAHLLEYRGVTLSKSRLYEIKDQYQETSTELGNVCLNIAKNYTMTCPQCDPTRKVTKKNPIILPCPVCCDTKEVPYDLELPAGGSVNNSLRNFLFDKLQLEGIVNPKAKTDAPSLNKATMEHYLLTLPERSPQLTFVRSLFDKREHDTAIGFLKSYERFWVPGRPSHVIMKKCGDPNCNSGNCNICDAGLAMCAICRKAESELDDPCTNIDSHILHPFMNPTATDTLRWSSHNPNEQNISKKQKFNVRYCFGPSEGREWWSLDAKNIELRLPAYESGEQDLINLFERSDEPPYYGSEHLLNFSAVYPDIWEQEIVLLTKELGTRAKALAKVGPHIKKKYESTYYKWVKNGDFAVGYGAINRPDGTGTADKAFRRPGSQARLESRFSKKEALNQKWIKFANKHGYVETMPDKSVDPTRGYPILCTRTEWGKILPTVPLNYHIQSTAMWWTTKGMIRCQEQLDEWYKTTGFDGFITMQVHDEMVFDFPKSNIHPSKDTGKFRRSNLWRIRQLQKLMEQGGDDIGIPTPVGVEYNETTWSEGITL